MPRFFITSKKARCYCTTIGQLSNGALSVAGQITSTPIGTTPELPMDVGLSKDGQHFYTLNGNQGTVSVFTIHYFGSQGLAVL